MLNQQQIAEITAIAETLSSINHPTGNAKAAADWAQCTIDINARFDKVMVNCGKEEYQQLNTIFIRGLNLFHLAANKGQTELIHKLLQKISPNVGDRLSGYNRTPLHFAADYGYIETVRELLNCSGVNINAKDIKGHQPIHYAARRRKPEVLQLLLTSPKIQIDKPTGFQTLLSLTIEHGCLESVRIVANYIIDFHTLSEKQKSCIFEECLKPIFSIDMVYQSAEKIKIIEEAKQTFKTIQNQRKLATIADDLKRDLNAKWNPHQQYWEFFSLQLNNQFDQVMENYNQEDYQMLNKLFSGRTLFQWAAKNGNIDLMHKLWKLNIDPNIVDNSGGSTALHLAAKHNNTDIVAFLLEIPGIKVNVKERDGYHAIHYAARAESPEMLKLLLQAEDIEINFKSNTNTPLGLAVCFGCIENVELLASALLNNMKIDTQDKLSSFTQALKAPYLSNEKKLIIQQSIDQVTNLIAEQQKAEKIQEFSAWRKDKRLLQQPFWKKLKEEEVDITAEEMAISGFGQRWKKTNKEAIDIGVEEMAINEFGQQRKTYN